MREAIEAPTPQGGDRAPERPRRRDAFLRQTGTLAFVVVDDDRLVYERYFDYHEPSLPVPWGDGVATYDGVDLREVALNATPVDYARFGLLFLHGGQWNGTRIADRQAQRS
jgi:CubicO group peptidase (beta-lactamase class C family)